MAIVNTPLGANSFQFDYSTATTLTEIMTALNSEILNGHGWELHDAAAGNNQVCYKALNKDGVTYKYVVLDLNTANSLRTKVYETWNEATHTGSNLCYGSDVPNNAGWVTEAQPGQIFLFISPRWLGFTTRNPFNGSLNLEYRSKQGIFGCFEFARDNVGDTAALNVPCFFFTNTSDFFANVAARGYVPRRKDGAVNSSASIELSCIMGKTNGGAFTLGHIVPSTKNPWNNKDWALTLYVHEPNFCVRGRIFGLKASTYNQYLILDRIIAKCDADFMYDAAGTDTEHHVINCTSSSDVHHGRVIIPV